MKSTNGMAITKGSGNVFSDLGFSPAESRNLKIRSEMMTALRKFIEKEGLTQAQAAKRLRVSQPRISALTRDQPVFSRHARQHAGGCRSGGGVADQDSFAARRMTNSGTIRSIRVHRNRKQPEQPAAIGQCLIGSDGRLTLFARPC